MRRPPIKSYLLSIACILALLSLSAATVAGVRGGFMAALSPFCKSFSWVKSVAITPLRAFRTQKIEGPDGKPQDVYTEALRLQAENLQLRNSIHHLEQILTQYEHPCELSHSRIVPAQVIFRAPSSWNHSLWINVGSSHNPADAPSVIAINSPVIIGNSLIGVIDFVGRHQSRVQLITDSRLNPSVQVLRNEKGQDQYLAKGEIHGSSSPLWRGAGQLLSGVGFNYDYPDQYGHSRDLRTGQLTGETSHRHKLALIKEGDLLVTTGMDGVFPPGLHVATVLQVKALREGSFAYDLEAKPTAASIADLSTVFVIPPTSATPTKNLL